METNDLQKLITLLQSFEDTYDIDTTDLQYQVTSEMKHVEDSVDG